MSSAFLHWFDPCMIASGKGMMSELRHGRLAGARAEAVTADPRRTSSKQIFPQSSKLEVPHSDLQVKEMVERQCKAKNSYYIGDGAFTKAKFEAMFLNKVYERCRHICAEYAKTFYLGTLLMTKERQKAIWAIYVWCRRTDELVDGPNAIHMTSAVLNRWEQWLDDIFDGRPYYDLDVALSDVVSNFPVDIKDKIEGMRMDTRKSRYENLKELYLYCYYVAGTVALMSVPVMGIAPESPVSAQVVYISALDLGIGNQLVNILSDVGEDAMRGRVYLPQDELAQFGLSDEDIFGMKVTDKWREFMKEEIRRAGCYFNQAEEGASQLDKDSRWPVWSSLILYRQILDAIEANDYDNLTKRANLGRTKKFLMLPLAYTRTLSSHSLHDLSV